MFSGLPRGGGRGKDTNQAGKRGPLTRAFPDRAVIRRSSSDSSRGIACFLVTPNAFLRERRLEESRNMLEQGKSVKETAELLGYRHTSNFIIAYRRKFGQTPGASRK